MANRSKVLLSLVALVTLVASVAFLFGGFGVSLHPMFTHGAGLSSTDYYPPSGSDPWGTTFDSNGNVWLAMPGCDPTPMCSSSTPPGKIAVFNPSGLGWPNNYTLPSGYAQALFLAIDSQGNVWFPMPMDNAIGMFNPSNNTFQQWTVPTASSGPWGIAIDHNGMIWFTEHYGNKIGRFDPSNHTFIEIPTPASNSLPYGITVDNSNNVWFTENNSAVALIGEYTSGGQLQEYKIRTGSTSNLTPHLLTVDPNGNIWWSEGWSTAIGELVVSKASSGTNSGVTEYTYQTTCSSCGSHTSGIGVDGSGQIWFDDSLQSIFGSFPDSGSGSFAIYATPTANSHPHDGMNVDSQNRIFFDEEFANKLAEAVQSGVPTPSPAVTPSPTASSTPGTTLAQDTFQRANQTHWGTASDGQSWGGDANSQSTFAIASNTGQVTNGGSIYNAVLGPAAGDAEVLFSGSLSSFSGTNYGAVVRWTDTNNWYKVYIDGQNLVVQKKVAGSTTVLGTASFPATAGTSYTMRFRVVGSSLYAKVWATSGTEPSTWMVTATDSSLSSGFCGLRMQMSSSAVLKITSFLATTPSLIATPSPSPTMSPSPTATSSPVITPTPGTTLAQDTFQRANQTHWGTASDGQSWGGDANSQSTFAIASNTGQVTNGGSIYNAVLGPVATNAEVLFSGSMSSFSGTNYGAVVRWTDTNNWYKAYIDGQNLVVQKKVAGSTTVLGTASFPATAGTSYTMRFRVVGTSLYAKVWATSGTEPSNWMVTATDSSLSSGYCGLRMQMSSSAVLKITSFLATAQ